MLFILSDSGPDGFAGEAAHAAREGADVVLAYPNMDDTPGMASVKTLTANESAPAITPAMLRAAYRASTLLVDSSSPLVRRLVAQSCGGRRVLPSDYLAAEAHCGSQRWDVVIGSLESNASRTEIEVQLGRVHAQLAVLSGESGGGCIWTPAHGWQRHTLNDGSDVDATSRRAALTGGLLAALDRGSEFEDAVGAAGWASATELVAKRL